ncbi:MAG: hypothetical protein H7Z18_11875 [Methylophilaceae bacterium]|nr:hypothetical protein [Methylophilaceae bacterium]
MKYNKTAYKLLALGFTTFFISQAHAFCNESQSILDSACKTVTDTRDEGNDSVYLPFNTYHLRSA